MRIRSGKAFAAAAIAASVAVAGCGSSSKTPVATGETGLAGAVSSLFAQSSMTVTVKLAMTAAQIEAEPDHPSAARAAQIAGSTVVVAVGTGNGKPLSTYQSGGSDPDATFSMELERSGVAPVEFLSSKGNLYGRVDLSELASAYRIPAATVSHAETILSNAARKIPSLTPLEQGKWVEVSKSQLSSITGILRVEAQAKGVKVPSSGVITGLLAAVRSAVAHSTTSSPVAGSGGSQYTVRLHVADLLEQLAAIPEVRTLAGMSNSPQLSRLPAIERQLGTKAATGTVTTANGTVSRLDINLAQFAHGASATSPVPLELDFSAAAPQAAPSSAAQINLLTILMQLGAG